MSESTGIYKAGDTAIHRLSPYTKLVLALSFTISAFAAHSLWVQVGLLLVCLLLLVAAKSLLRVFKATYRFFLFFILVLFLVQSLFWVGESATLTLGPLEIQVEGVLFACQVTLRLLTVLSSFYLLLATTHPSNLVFDLEQRGLPPRLGFVALTSLQAIDELQSRASTILQAQQCRGVEIQGSLRVRLRAYFPIIAPLIIGSVLDIENRALALELRGFSADVPKTVLREYGEQPWERWLRGGLLLLPAVILLARLLWYFQ